MVNPDYTPEERNKNQLTILLCAAGFLGIVVISGTLQGWSLSSFVAIFVIVFAVAFVFWKLFASQSSRRLPSDRKYARWPYLSKKKFDEISKPKP